FSPSASSPLKKLSLVFSVYLVSVFSVPLWFVCLSVFLCVLCASVVRFFLLDRRQFLFHRHGAAEVGVGDEAGVVVSLRRAAGAGQALAVPVLPGARPQELQ